MLARRSDDHLDAQLGLDPTLELVAVEFGASIELEHVDGVPLGLLFDDDLRHDGEPAVDVVRRHVHAVPEVRGVVPAVQHARGWPAARAVGDLLHDALGGVDRRVEDPAFAHLVRARLDVALGVGRDALRDAAATVLVVLDDARHRRRERAHLEVQYRLLRREEAVNARHEPGRPHVGRHVSALHAALELGELGRARLDVLLSVQLGEAEDEAVVLER